ncbi:MAG TPA: alpha/beta fold hydrolase [Nocardioides sp.]|nr:alpha/beta fold hydrolase [Nocardioides sp.]
MSRVLGLLVVAVLVAACSEETDDAAPPPEVARVTDEALTDRCGGIETPETETTRVDSSTGEQLYAVAAGTGETAVVLVHGSGTIGVCAWAADIGWLADAGHRVIGYDAACVGNSTCDADEPAPVDDLASVVATARDGGAERVVVLAASAGGPMAAQIAAVPDAGVDGAVALSPADLSLEVPGSDLSTADAAAAATVPVLYVLAEDDPYAEPAEVRTLADASPTAELLVPRGSGHAQELLTSESGRPTEVRRAVLEFVAGP